MNSVNQKTIIVAEDERTIRGNIAINLQAEGHEVLEAGTGEEALRIMEQAVYKIDLLITDGDMPPGKITGEEVAEIALEHNISVILQSAFIPENLDSRITTIKKPYSPGKIIDLVRQKLLAI